MRPERLYLLTALFLFGVALLCLAWVLHAGAAGEIPVRVGTDSYTLDTGDTVTVWLDEPHALLCTMVERARTIGGVACLPLTATSYNWPALPESLR